MISTADVLVWAFVPVTATRWFSQKEGIFVNSVMMIMFFMAASGGQLICGIIMDS